jgi:hypothetical protein
MSSQEERLHRLMAPPRPPGDPPPEPLGDPGREPVGDPAREPVEEPEPEPYPGDEERGFSRDLVARADAAMPLTDLSIVPTVGNDPDLALC